MDSDRIADFRTQTIQSAVSPFLSPYPAVLPDTRLTSDEGSSNVAE